MTVHIGEVVRDGRVLWQFTCDVCGRRSALFSTRDLADAEGNTAKNGHVRYRCTGPATR